MEPNNPIARLFGSSKALVVLAVTIASFAAVFAGKVGWNEASEFLKWVLGPWLIAQGAEDAAKHFANRPKDAGSSAVVVNNAPPTDPSA